MNSSDSGVDQSIVKVKRKTWVQVKRNYELYLFLLPILLVYLVFKYYPMYGVQIAFKDFSPSQGIWGSEWVGFKHFIDFFDSYNFWTIMSNTLTLSVLSLVFGFPARYHRDPAESDAGQAVQEIYPNGHLCAALYLYRRACRHA
ncbi:hypothetical protein HMSSN036_11900 [Paenibacillus macerans]|nr:hypothetical protein HMSSN036_11900 [Paenibacillus macerans]